MILIKGIQEQGSKINILGILPTMVQDHTNLHNVMLQDLRKRFAETQDIKVFDTVIKRAIRHGLAQSNGEPDIKNAPEYLSFVKEVFAIAWLDSIEKSEDDSEDSSNPRLIRCHAMGDQPGTLIPDVWSTFQKNGFKTMENYINHLNSLFFTSYKEEVWNLR